MKENKVREYMILIEGGPPVIVEADKAICKEKTMFVYLNEGLKLAVPLSRLIYIVEKSLRR